MGTLGVLVSGGAPAVGSGEGALLGLVLLLVIATLVYWKLS